MVYEDVVKIYGPHEGKDGRLRIGLRFKDGSTKGMSYPKYLMEKWLNRYFTKDETVDHIDGNPLNNERDNLRVLPRSIHASLDVKRRLDQNFLCPMCKKKFKLGGIKMHNAIQNRKKGRAGPFCSKSCAGRYGASVQNGRGKLAVKEIKVEYTTWKKEGKSGNNV